MMLRSWDAKNSQSILNRGNARNEVFHKDGDYGAFLKLHNQVNDRANMRLLAFCLMPNHFHLVAWPREEGDLSSWMQWLMTSHVRRYHRLYDSSGHVWQSRFKAFPIQTDEHLLTVTRYVERNPVISKTIPVPKAQNWPWSSATTPPGDFEAVEVYPSPVEKRKDWLAWVNKPLSEKEHEAIRKSLVRGSLFGSPQWQRRISKRLGLESTLRSIGRPRRPTSE